MDGTIHDLGKISIPAEILSKPTKLTDLEYQLIQAHPRIGYDILKGIEFPWLISDIILQHHERMNGSGYPQGLKGEEISTEARVCFSDDSPVNDLIVIDLEKTPSFKESLHQNLEHIQRVWPAGKAVSRYVLKEIPLFYQEEPLGILYPRINTHRRRLIHREEYFLSSLSEITATVLYNLESPMGHFKTRKGYDL